MSDAPQPRLELREAKLADLRPDPQNVKQHSDQQIAQIMASIDRFGFRDPIGVMPDMLIIEGGGRYMAAERMGMETVPILVIHGLSAREARAYAIAHNQTTFNTGLDYGVVREEFDRLGVTPDDFVSLGITPDDAAFLSLDDTPQQRRDHNGHVAENLNDLLPPVALTVIDFDSQEQYAAWTMFLEASRERYSGLTIAERIVQFIQEFSNGN